VVKPFDGALAAQIPLKQGPITLTDKRLVDDAHSAGLQVHVWTIDEPDEMEHLLNLGVDGIMTESLAGHVDFGQSFALASDTEVLATVWIDLLDRSDVTNPVSISGSACTFEANVTWELSLGGEVVKTGATMAATACPDRSNWSIELGELTPGNYDLKVSDVSAEDGSLVFADTKAFTVIN
jgi:hypothetical protein